MEEVQPFKPHVYTYVCDVGKRESVYSTAERVRREVGDVDLLINNAGVVSGQHLLECPDELIERTMVVNCHAHFWVSRTCTPSGGRRDARDPKPHFRISPQFCDPVRSERSVTHVTSPTCFNTWSFVETQLLFQSCCSLRSLRCEFLFALSS